MIIYLAPGANAVATAKVVRAFLQEEKRIFRRASITSSLTTPPTSSARRSGTCWSRCC